jgi:hypothetical protein
VGIITLCGKINERNHRKNRLQSQNNDPKNIRKAAKVKAGTYVNIKAKDITIIIEPAESIAEKYGGIFQITKWPEDLDEFTEEATRKWWINHATT